MLKFRRISELRPLWGDQEYVIAGAPTFDLGHEFLDETRLENRGESVNSEISDVYGYDILQN
jgi:hypothetical protein